MSLNATNQARRPRMGVRHHHGYPPYDVWDESIPYLPASIPSTLVPPPQRSLRIIQPTRSTTPAQHCPSSATYTESDALPCSNQEGGISHATRRHMPTQPRTTCTVPDPYRPLRQFDLRGSSQHGTTTQHTTPRRACNRAIHNGQLLQRRHKRQRNMHTIEREAVLLSCYASTLPPREQFTEPRGYLDEGSMYTTCAAPGDTQAPSNIPAPSALAATDGIE